MLLEPLRVRPGARFTCHGDGLCCTDVHALGPIDDKSAAMLQMINEEVVVVQDDDRFILHGDEGACVFSKGGACMLHAELGPSVKPDACRQYPYSLIATPLGGRVSTRHYCPCRSMGERAALDAAEALAACGGGPADRKIRDRMAFDEKSAIDLHEWESLEAGLLERLAAGESPETVLDVTAYASRTGGQWEQLARELFDDDSGGRFQGAQRLFGATVLRALGVTVTRSDDPIPWSDAFDRAQGRSALESPDAMLNDWVADVLWSLEWAFMGTYRQACVDLVTRVDVARRIAAAHGGREDRAMAEAIAVVELVGMGEDYQAFVGTLPS